MEASYHTSSPGTYRIRCVQRVSTFAKRLFAFTVIILGLTLSIDRCYAQDSSVPPDQPVNQHAPDIESAGQLLGQLEDIKTIDVKERVDDQLIVSRINNILTASDWFGNPVSPLRKASSSSMAILSSVSIGCGQKQSRHVRRGSWLLSISWSLFLIRREVSRQCSARASACSIKLRSFGPHLC